MKKLIGIEYYAINAEPILKRHFDKTEICLINLEHILYVSKEHLFTYTDNVDVKFYEIHFINGTFFIIPETTFKRLCFDFTIS